MKTTSLLLFVALSMALGACSPKKDSALDKDPIEKGYRLIDQGKNSEAIDYLEELSHSDPRIEVKEALASAYAARAGVHVEDYWGFLVGFQAPLLEMRSLELSVRASQVRRILTQLEGQRELRGHRGLAELSQVVASFELWMNRIDTLPVVDGSARADIDRAMLVMNGDDRGGGRMYRALLGLVTLKSDLLLGFTSWEKVETKLARFDFANPESARNTKLLCGVDTRGFAKWAAGILRRLHRTIDDVIVALPSKQEDLAGALRETKRMSGDLARAAKEDSCE